MNNSDLRRWQAPKTIAELGEVTALWLEGKISSQPGYEENCGPDEETSTLIRTLAAVNRSGYMTTASQPGEDGAGYDGAHWRQRASVDGFANDPMYERLAAAAKQRGLIFIAHKAGWRSSQKEAVTVTERQGRPVTGFGACLSRRHIQDSWTGYGICSREAQDALCKARHGTSRSSTRIGHATTGCGRCSIRSPRRRRRPGDDGPDERAVRRRGG